MIKPQEVCFGAYKFGDIPRNIRRKITATLVTYDKYHNMFSRKFDTYFEEWLFFVYLVCEDWLLPSDEEIAEGVSLIYD